MFHLFHAWMEFIHHKYASGNAAENMKTEQDQKEQVRGDSM